MYKRSLGLSVPSLRRQLTANISPQQSVVMDSQIHKFMPISTISRCGRVRRPNGDIVTRHFGRDPCAAFCFGKFAYLCPPAPSISLSTSDQYSNPAGLGRIVCLLVLSTCFTADRFQQWSDNPVDVEDRHYHASSAVAVRSNVTETNLARIAH